MEAKEETKYLNPTSKVEYAEFEEQPVNEPQAEKSGWAKVAIGSATGILLGAGAVYAVSSESNKEDQAPDVSQTEGAHPLKVGEVSEDMSFTDAFNSARAQVGSGGVFHWHGRIYSTYTTDEWDQMTAESRESYAQAVKPEIKAGEMENAYVAEAHTVAHSHAADHDDVQPVSHESAQATVQQQTDVEPAYVAASQSHQEATTSDDDVHIVAQGTVQGHAAATVDLNGDGDADVAVIDVNDNQVLDDPDVVVDQQGNMATVGQIAEASGQHTDAGTDYAMQQDANNDPNMQQVSYGENPDVSPDMPDYMNDADMATMV